MACESLDSRHGEECFESTLSRRPVSCGGKEFFTVKNSWTWKKRPNFGRKKNMEETTRQEYIKYHVPSWVLVASKKSWANQSWRLLLCSTSCTDIPTSGWAHPCAITLDRQQLSRAHNTWARPFWHWLIDGLVGWLVDWMIDWLIEWLNDWLNDWMIEWLLDALNDWMNDWLIDGLNDWLMDWLRVVQ